VSEFRESFKSITPEVAIRAFSLGPTETPIFEQQRLIGHEAISFLYMAALSVPRFVPFLASQGYSNVFILTLLSTARAVFEKLRFCYLHSVIIAIILLFVVDPVVCERLNEEATLGSYADLLFDELVTLCRQESLWPSLVFIFHMVAPYVSSFSQSVAQKVVSLCKTIIEGQELLAPPILEGFASIVQQPEKRDNNMVLALVQRSRWIRSLNFADHRSVRALSILRSFLKLAAGEIKSAKRNQIVESDLNEILRNVRVPEGERHVFPKSQLEFGGEMEKTWPECTQILFIRSFTDEVFELRSFHSDLEPSLVAALSNACPERFKACPSLLHASLIDLSESQSSALRLIVDAFLTPFS
jgi:hypothetical protein